MKINFKQFEARTSFSGTRQVFDIAEALGNGMMFNGSVLLDIGFEKLAEEIYYSAAPVEVPEKYREAIKVVVKSSNFIAAVKRELIKRLENTDNEEEAV